MKGASMSTSANERDEAGEDRVDEATKEEEEREARASHRPDRPPTPDEDAAAEGIKPDPEVAAHEREMGGIGAEVKGEGEIR
jgi:hypothetical protein